MHAIWKYRRAIRIILLIGSILLCVILIYLFNRTYILLDISATVVINTVAFSFIQITGHYTHRDLKESSHNQSNYKKEEISLEAESKSDLEQIEGDRVEGDISMSLERVWVENEQSYEEIQKMNSITRARQKRLKKMASPPGFKRLRELERQDALILSIALSPDGNMLASGSENRVIQLWDTETGRLLRTLNKHVKPVYCVSWSPDGRTLASCSEDATIRLWDTRGGYTPNFIPKQPMAVYSLAWSPDGKLLAFGSADSMVRIWNIETQLVINTFAKHTALVDCLAWSPDGYLLASGSDDKTIQIWDIHTGQSRYTLPGHSDAIFGLAWSPDGHLLASGSGDSTIRLWDLQVRRLIRILEGHTDAVFSVAFSPDGTYLASKSADGTVRLWDTTTWDLISILEETSSSFWTTGLLFHPTQNVLITLGKEDRCIHMWKLDIDTILSAYSAIPSVSYANAKVVLLGDSGVGKSALGFALSGEEYKPMESTHGRRIWTFDTPDADLDDNHREAREILLWDMAGQPGYRIFHQLHLNEVTVALVVFDARSELDPFAGVRYWSRALDQARHLQGSATPPLKKFLVVGRTDRGGVGASHERIEAIVKELHFDNWFETSAKEGRKIAELKAAIGSVIDWNMLPRVTSTELFQYIKRFIIKKKGNKYKVLANIDDLYDAFSESGDVPVGIEDLKVHFEHCIMRMESVGLVKRLSFGNLILVQPELLDSYASALINAVKDEPDGLGYIAEERISIGDFRMPLDERIEDREQEKLLLIAMVEDLLLRELVWREGSFLVFPSQSTRDPMADPEGKSVIFDFEGPVESIYATLAVRLANSILFKKKDLWKNAITYTTSSGAICGISLRNNNEGKGELTLFFDPHVSPETRSNFEEYVKTHLQRRALPKTIKRRAILTCSGCGWIIEEREILVLRKHSLSDFTCPACKRVTPLLENDENIGIVHSQSVQTMDRAADKNREIAINKSQVIGKKEIKEFDVFLCYNSIDRVAVKDIGEDLERQGISPWLDEWHLRPGMHWQRVLGGQIEQVKSAAVFVGREGIGPWQRVEVESFLIEFVSRGLPVIPVILKDAPLQPPLPIFLKPISWVDFRLEDPDPLERLVWGITGKHRLSR